MQYTYLGRSGLKVSRLCLGTMNFGPTTDEKEAFRIMDAAIDAGVNFFDTANVYGGTAHRGWTEEIIGRWFAQGGGRREKVVLATKVHGAMGDDPHDPNGCVRGLSAYKIRRHLETLCGAFRPTTWSFTRCTTSTGTFRGTSCGKRLRY